jgi:endonuclease G
MPAKFMKQIHLAVGAILLAAWFALRITGCSIWSRPDPANLLMGNPSQAKHGLFQWNNFLLEKRHFALSYNNRKGIPNWVSWRLSKKDVGSAPRKEFHPEPDLPFWFTQITPSDYTGSGFDRGHLCPHSDRSADDDMSYETFSMANMIPQSPRVNEKAWAQLETYCRELVEHEHKTLYIIDGPAGQGGTGRDGFKEEAGRQHQVVVPAKCWKVIMVLDAGEGNDSARVSANTRIISVIIPNDMSVGENWSGFRVSVKEIETLTGYKFFDRIPASVIEPLKTRVDSQVIPHAKSVFHGPLN